MGVRNPSDLTLNTKQVIEDDDNYALYEEQDNLIEEGIRLICTRIN